MKDGKPPHQQLTVEDNGLTSTQEVIYQQEYKRADRATGQKKSEKRK